MAVSLDQYLLNQSKARAAKKDVPLMLDEDYLPPGEVTYNPEQKNAGIPIKGATINAQGKVTAPIKPISTELNAPIPQQKVDEIKAIFKPAPEVPAPQQPQAPVPEKQPEEKKKGFDWSSLLPALAPLAVEGILGTQAGGTAGEGAAIASKFILDEEGKKQARAQALEDKLMAMQQARELASIKASGKQKPLTTSNVLPYVAEDGKIRYRLVSEALEEEKPTEAQKGLTFEQRAELQRRGQQFSLGKEARKEQIQAGARFQQRLEQDKEYLGLKSQISNADKAVEYLSQGKNIADVGIKRVFAKGIFGDVGNLAVQEQADIAGAPDLYSRYQTLKAKFNTPGVQFSDRDRAELMEFAQVIRNSAPKKLEALVKQRMLAEKAISGDDVSDVARALYTVPGSEQPMVKVMVIEEDPKTKKKVKNIYELPASEYPNAVKKHGAKLYIGNK